MLGCARKYTAELRTRDGSRRRAPLTGLTRATWERALNATSRATLEITPRSRACAAALRAALPWSCEIALWRGDEQVWAGPVMDTDDGATAGSVTITAADVSVWLGHRILHTGYDTTDAATDAALVAGTVIRDAFAPDDPQVLRQLHTVPGAAPIARAVAPETVYAAAELAELASLGVGWTVTGRQIVLFPLGHGLGRLPALGPRHFGGDQQRLLLDGSRTVTRAILQGGGVRAEAGGVDPVFGLLEYLDTQASFTSDADAALAAAGHLARPSTVLDGSGHPLTARAPVTVAELVPGAMCPVTGRGTVLDVTAAMMLVKVTGEWSTTGEAITPTFADLVVVAA